MYKSFIGAGIVLLIFMLNISGCDNNGTSGQQDQTVREKINFNQEWKFRKEIENNYRNVTLPHTVHVEPLVVNNQWQGTSFYEKSFSLEDIDEKKIFIEFEGVMQEADVWVNGEFITHHEGGYLPFTVDISDVAAVGQNDIRVKVVNEDNPMIPPGKPLETLDFNTYGGIYRNVHLLIANEVHITNPVAAEKPASGGLLVHFDQVSKDNATGSIQIHVQNDSEKSSEVKAAITLTDPEGEEIKFETSKQTIAAGQSAELRSEMNVTSPALWSIYDPNLYDLRVEVLTNGKTVDAINEKIGIRSIELGENGFLLNGEKLYLRGTNRHQEYPYVGYAITDNADYRDAVKIKNSGFDFVRLSHYPHSEAFLDACDELGLLVMNAIPGWQWYKEDSAFQANAKQDIRDMVRRDRNHPSVIFWEVSLNESGMTDEFISEADRILKEELPFDDTYSAGWMDHPDYDLFIPARQHSKAPDYWNFYNDGERKIFIAEYGDWEYYAQNAGFNQKAFEDLKEEERTSRQLRVHGETRLLQQALNFQEAANSNRKGTGTIGHANWVMFDYNRGYADDLEASGISDIFRIPKFTYYFYKSQRDPREDIDHEDVEDGPIVKIANFWTPDSPTDVKVYSNCDEVALYLNGEMIAKQKPTVDQFSDHLPHPPFIFKLRKFEKGELKAVAYLDGKEVATDVVNTPGEAYAIRLKIDTSGKAIDPEHKDVVFVYAEIVDEKGTIIPTANHKINFTLNGTGQLLGNPVKGEAGIATVLLQTTGVDKKLVITAEGEGLNGDKLAVGGDALP